VTNALLALAESLEQRQANGVGERSQELSLTVQRIDLGDHHTTSLSRHIPCSVYTVIGMYYTQRQVSVNTGTIGVADWAPLQPGLGPRLTDENAARALTSRASRAGNLYILPTNA